MDDYQGTLNAAKRQSTIQLLFRAARLVDERALAEINAKNPAFTVRPAHTRLLPYISLAGSRTTEIAAKVGITKQAVGQLVDDLEQAGVVERSADPDDGRARLVRFTAHGRAALLHGLSALAELEGALATQMGPGQMDALHGALLALLGALGDDGA
jgi:DNA-binding MarR family transcriptional regulator